MCCSFHLIGCKDTESKATDEMPIGKKTLENQNYFEGSHSAEKLDLPNLELSFSKLVTQGQRCNNQKSRPVIFPKQVFRLGPPTLSPRANKRITEKENSPLAEMKIWKGRNEFGQTVLRYSRNHFREDWICWFLRNSKQELSNTESTLLLSKSLNHRHLSQIKSSSMLLADCTIIPLIARNVCKSNQLYSQAV